MHTIKPALFPVRHGDVQRRVLTCGRVWRTQTQSSWNTVVECKREADVEILGQRKRCIKHYGMEVYSYLW